MKRLFAALLAGLALLSLPTAAGAIEIKQVTTPLGIKAWLVEDKSTPVIALSFSFAGGTASDPAGNSAKGGAEPAGAAGSRRPQPPKIRRTKLPAMHRRNRLCVGMMFHPMLWRMAGQV